MPDEPPPDEEQPAWMTPEGRVKVIRFKNLSAGEEYTEDELHKLRAYWTEDRTQAVAMWIDEGTPEESDENVPECLPKAGLTMFGNRLLDLRGFDPFPYLHTVRTNDSPTPDLTLAHLEHADLTLAHLEHIELFGAHLEHADLHWAHLEHADLHWASLEHAGLTEANLEHANLRWAHLEHAGLYGANLEHANLDGAHLEHADLSDVWILETDLADIYLDDTIFRKVEWQDERRRDPEATMLRGFDARGVRYSDPLFDQWVRQANFVARCRETWWNPWAVFGKRLWPDEDEDVDSDEAGDEGEEPRALRGKLAVRLRKWPPPLWLLWKLTCNCGRSFLRWAAWCLGIAIVFGFIFWLGGVVEAPGPSEAGRQPNALTYFYFSIVTFTTLGFGDVTPTGNAGEIWVMLEVILGYVGLGGLISIFTTKLIPPR